MRSKQRMRMGLDFNPQLALHLVMQLQAVSDR